MEQKNAEHFDYLDGWRGLAICFLLIGHFFPVPGINFGAVGVNFFFVLSGLFMSRLLFIKQVPLTVFYRRRISRIFPATFVFIGAIVAFAIVGGVAVRWDETAAAALFVNNYFAGEPGKAFMPFGHIWSLSVEEHSYVLLALIALAARRSMLSPAWTVLLVSSGCIAATFYYFQHPELNDLKWLRTEVAGFGIFVSAFITIVLDRRKVRQVSWLLCPLLILAGIALHWWSVPAPVKLIFGVGAFALAVNLLPVAPDIIKRMFSFRWLRWLGVLSFSIYLWQQPFYLLMHRAGWNSLLALGAALLLGVMSFYLVERPVREYLNARWGTGERTREQIRFKLSAKK
ncbi:acyltransferase family protein [Noviherbaspirillum denitrificans]|uniref:Acyltransferase 3 domain-containing protein n=1 Tax=Noviherbaspirillum denitrificans TaxID=1968433 RepID=A0A254TCL9_9BURK|nr:acyltransferase [Noviherbaspirillum denitrificans]OWW20406.1 hypothetical protein AYR66_13840 [Noviherbaspirillum denitrificans]